MRSEREDRGLLKSTSGNPALAHEDIASRAYQRYVRRGSTHGNDIDDWLAAEQELAQERVEARPSRRLRPSKPEVG